ncbi:MAG TPA: hypothetical protein VLJ68_08665 [Chitinophagaceae bacterium]|nr:hypothetical protein [Chitinophagaceae bacterium]
MKPLIIILLLTFFNACSSDKKETAKTEKYSIDPAIIADASRYTRTENGELQGQIQVTMYINDSVEVENHKNHERIPYNISTSEDKDTLTIVGWAAAFQNAGMGYMIKITTDGYEVFYGIDTGIDGNYKLNSGDPAYSHGIWVPAVKSKLVLSKKPEPSKPGIHPLLGFVDFETRDFYEKNKKNEKVEDVLDKIKVRMSAYFKT